MNLACDYAIISLRCALPGCARLTLSAVYYNNVDSAEWQRAALCSSATRVRGGAGALCGALPGWARVARRTPRSPYGDG